MSSKKQLGAQTRQRSRIIDRDKIDRLIDIYISTVSREEVGWPKESMLAKFIEYHGSFQGSSSTAGLEKYVERMEKTHARFGDITVALGELDEPKVLAILSRRYLRGLGHEDKPYTNADRATAIGQTLRQFEGNILVGYRHLSKTLDLLKKRENLS